MAPRSSKVDDHVGMRIRERRRELGMSQSDLAGALGISFQQVQKYEIGTNRVAASRLWDMGKALDVDIEYFFEGIARSGRTKAAGRRPGKSGTISPAKRHKVRR